MASARKVLSVVGTRPEAIKLFPLIHALSADRRFVSRVCTSGQHGTLLKPVLDMAGVRPDHALPVHEGGQGLDGLFSAVLEGVGCVLDAERPDWVVVQGDTTTAVASALAAYHRRVPVLHIEAGLRSGDLDSPWPEEGNRRMIAGLAALHCAPTNNAAAALRQEGAAADAIHVTGNTGIDALLWVLAQAERQPDLTAGFDALCERFQGRRIVGVTTHRRENHGQGLHNIADAVRQIAERGDVAVICPVHPNPQVRATLFQRLSGQANIVLTEPLAYPQFARLLSRACLLLTDSGGVQEEAPSLGKPVLVLRETTERPEAVTAGTAKLVGTSAERIVAETATLLDDAGSYRLMARAHNPFGDGRASGRIVAALADAL